MRIVVKIALGNILAKPRRTLWTLFGIMLSASVMAMLCVLVGAMLSSPAVSEEQEAFSRFALGLLLLTLTVCCMTAASALDVCFTGRTKQLAHLASVGMSRCLRCILVLTETLFYAFLAVLPGVALGAAAASLLYNAASALFAEWTGEGLGVFSWHAEWILLAYGLAVLSVLLASLLPLFRMARITVLDALRNREKVNISLAQGIVGRVSERLFGRLGRLAGQNYENSKRRYRAVSFALTGGTIFFFLFYCLYLYGDGQISDAERPFWQIFNSSCFGFGALLLLVFLLCAMGCISVATDSRRHEFGALLSLGLSRTTIAKMLCIESLYFVAYAAFYSLIASLVTDGLLYAFLVATGYDEAFRYPIELYLAFLLLDSAVGAVFALYTAWKLKKTDIASTMRQEM